MAATLNSTGVLFGDSLQQDTVAYTGFRNLIDNGDFRVDRKYRMGSRLMFAQLITGQPAGTYYSRSEQAQDRWVVGSEGLNANYTHAVTTQKITFNAGSGANFTYSSHGLYVNCSSYFSSTADVRISQRIEAVDAAKCAAKTMTLSAVFNSTNITSVTWTIYSTNSTNIWTSAHLSTVTSKAAIATGTFTGISVSPSLKTATITMPNITTCEKGLEIVFSFTPTASGQGFNITQVQFEMGSVRTPFENKPLSYEMQRAERFCPVYYGFQEYATQAGTFGLANPIAFGKNASTSPYGTWTIPLSTKLRQPISGISYSSGAALEWIGTSTAGTITSFTTLTSTADVIILTPSGITSQTGFTAHGPSYIQVVSGVGNIVWFTGAEL